MGSNFNPLGASAPIELITQTTAYVEYAERLIEDNTKSKFDRIERKKQEHSRQIVYDRESRKTLADKQKEAQARRAVTSWSRTADHTLTKAVIKMTRKMWADKMLSMKLLTDRREAEQLAALRYPFPNK